MTSMPSRGRPQVHVVSNQSRRGVMVNNPAYQGPVVQLSGKLCPLTIRIIPVKNYDDPNYFDTFMRMDAHGNQVPGDWLWTGNIADRIGSIPNLITFLFDPRFTAAEVNNNPVSALVKKCYNYAAQRKVNPASDIYNAFSLIDKGDAASKTSKIAPLKEIGDCGIVLGVIMQQAGKMMKPARGLDGNAPIIILPSTAKRALVNAIKVKLQEDPTFDLVAFSKGAYVKFFEKGKDFGDGDGSGAPAVVSDVDSMVPAGSTGGQQQDWSKGFECRIVPTFNAEGKAYSAAWTSKESLFQKTVGTWDDILSYPTKKEMVEHLSNIFPKGLVLEAISDHPEWIPDSLKNWKPEPVQANVPLGLPQAGYGQLPGMLPTSVPGGVVLPPAPPQNLPPVQLPQQFAQPVAQVQHYAPVQGAPTHQVATPQLQMPQLFSQPTPVPVQTMGDLDDLTGPAVEEAPFDTTPQPGVQFTIPQNLPTPQSFAAPQPLVAPQFVPQVAGATMAGSQAVASQIEIMKQKIAQAQAAAQV